MENYTYGSLLGNEPVSESVKVRVTEEIQKLGSLSFQVTKDEDGWAAQCNELPAIIASGTGSNPSNTEIETEIRAAIFAVFDVTLDSHKAPGLTERFQYAIA